MIDNAKNKDSMDLKKELWLRLTAMENGNGKADTYYDILALFNVSKSPDIERCDLCDEPKVRKAKDGLFLCQEHKDVC